MDVKLFLSVSPVFQSAFEHMRAKEELKHLEAVNQNLTGEQQDR